MKRTYLLGAVLLFAVITAGCIGPQYPSTLTQDDINQTASAVSNSESVTLEVTITTDRTDQRRTLEYNNTTQRVLSTRYVDGEQVRQRYVTNDRDYQWNSGSPTFEGRDGSRVSPPDDNQFTQPLTSVITLDESVERTGTTTYNGNAVAVYEATDEQITVTGGSIGPSPAENATVTLYATSDGRVTYTEYETDRGTVTASITDLNTTQVDSPSWTSVAERENSVDPPRMGTTLSTDANNETVTVTVTDPGNADSFSVEVDGTVMQTVDGNAARVESPTTNTTLTLDLSTEAYDATDALILVVAEHEGTRGVVDSIRPT